MKRFVLPIGLNLPVPGPGLIALGRPWLGVALATWFVLAMGLGAFGLLVAPATIPPAVSGAALSLGLLVWLLGQILLGRRIRFLRSADLPRELTILRRLAQLAMSRKDYRAADAALAIALSLNDADPASYALQARLMDLTGRPGKARRARTLAARLDADQRRD